MNVLIKSEIRLVVGWNEDAVGWGELASPNIFPLHLFCPAQFSNPTYALGFASSPQPTFGF